VIRWWLKILFLGALPSLLGARACDLCAIYSAENARGQSNQGFVAGASELFVPYRTLQFEGKELDTSDYLDSSITHIFATYNFSDHFGLSLNIPLITETFQRSEVRFFPAAPPAFGVENGTESGIGDLALVGRWTVYQKKTMKYSFAVGLLGGIKFPTGDASRLTDEVEQSAIFQSFLPPDVPHDPLSHNVSGVHQHMITLGSGSFDGIAGLNLYGNWKRAFFSGQFQYYIRTEGEATFRYGDDLYVSGGPGAYLVLREGFSLSLQANAAYEIEGHDELLGKVSYFTGMTAWYLGPILTATWGEHLAFNAGADIPLHISNSGLQNVPDYRIHGGISWRF
jgi:hypothetical protein